MYKILAYNISADNEKITCTDFLFSKRKIVIYYSEIELLEGGIFDGRYNGLAKVCDRKSKMCIGFFSKISNSVQLEKTLLSNVNEQVYNRVLQKLKASKRNAPLTAEREKKD
jgi:hypothetical protein